MCTLLRAEPVGMKSLRTLFADIKSVNGVLKNLLYISRNRKLLYVTDATWSTPTHTFEHLSCFYPGLLALGVMTLSLTEADKQLHMSAARGLADTCYLSYQDQISGLGPDVMRFDSSGTKWLPEYDFWLTNGASGTPPGVWGANATSTGTNRGYSNSVGNYLLRPEVSARGLLHSSDSFSWGYISDGRDVFCRVSCNQG